MLLSLSLSEELNIYIKPPFICALKYLYLIYLIFITKTYKYKIIILFLNLYEIPLKLIEKNTIKVKINA
jgi:hypothetical protein